MTTTAKLNELNHAERQARELLERLGWTYVPRAVLAAEREDERRVLLTGRLSAALLRLNEWMTEDQAQRVIFNLQHVDATGLGRNQRIHGIPAAAGGCDYSYAFARAEMASELIRQTHLSTRGVRG